MIDIQFLKDNESRFVDSVLRQHASGLTKSLDVNYHPPRVHRVHSQYGFGDLRINLHKIYPCRSDEALLHPHPWASGMIVFSEGEYEMGIGHSPGNDPKDVKIDCTLSMSGKFYYVMNEKDAWHYVAPKIRPAYSIMVTQKTWDRWSPKPEGILQALQNDYVEEIVSFFKDKYGF